jgi:hypothetical protein
MATAQGPAGLRRPACPGVQGLDDVGGSGRDRLAPEFHGGVISPPPGCQRPARCEPLYLLDPGQLAVGGLDRQALGVMLAIVESSDFTTYNAGEFYFATARDRHISGPPRPAARPARQPRPGQLDSRAQATRS